MKKIVLLFTTLWFCYFISSAQTDGNTRNTLQWKASWIGLPDSLTKSNAWICYQKKFSLATVPDIVMANISTDTKYWLWINGKMVVFEGQLKRGPNPKDTYFDIVDIQKYLVKGDNVIAILEWYFGKSGFSHNSSGKAGLVFESEPIKVYSDTSWKVALHPAYYNTTGDQPNFRLAEHNIGFDARLDFGKWYENTYNTSAWAKATVFGTPPCLPWGNLIVRPIPLFKDYSLKSYPEVVKSKKVLSTRRGDTLEVQLPYNAQVTPYLKVKAKAGMKIHMLTDDYFVANNKDFQSVRAEYITKKGLQEYESYGWMNGHKMRYIIPKGVKVKDIKYRETGYNTEFTGMFSCSDDFYNKLWLKSQRTLYVNMRDNYFDCPDRERAQWWGDVVLEQGEAFYAFDSSANLLARKGILELFNWQKADKVIYAPVPGNWDQELPQQILAVMSSFGLYNYFQNTGDFYTYSFLYPRLQNYMSLWKLNDQGSVIHRKGGWDWGDWGSNVDIELLDNCWYYMALQETSRMASLSGKVNDVLAYSAILQKMKANFEKNFWNKDHYRSVNYKDATDDRANAMAVLSGLADTSHYGAVRQVLLTQEHASPYMEKYVLEALFRMNCAKDALARMKKRYTPMIESPLTTLWEGWVLSKDNTYNHGWSGGPLTLLSQYIAGVSPTEIGGTIYKVAPRLDLMNTIEAKVPTLHGTIKMKAQKTDSGYVVKVNVPQNVLNNVLLSKNWKNIQKILINNKVAWANGAKVMNMASAIPGGRQNYKNQPQYYVNENKDAFFIAVSGGEFEIKFY